MNDEKLMLCNKLSREINIYKKHLDFVKSDAKLNYVQVEHKSVNGTSREVLYLDFFESEEILAIYIMRLEKRLIELEKQYEEL